MFVALLLTTLAFVAEGYGTPAPHPPSGGGTIEYKGCFHEDAAVPELTANLHVAPDAHHCLDMCLHAGFHVAGLKAHNECWCGNRYGAYGRETGCPCDQAQGGLARRASESTATLSLTCVYGEQCCKEHTAECGACKHGLSEYEYCEKAGANTPGCRKHCATHPHIHGCKGGKCYRNEKDYGAISSCPAGTRMVRYVDNYWNDQRYCEEEYACEVNEAKELCDYSAAETNALFAFHYFVEWGKFPHPQQQKLFEKLLESPEVRHMDAMLKHLVDDMDDQVAVETVDDSWTDTCYDNYVGTSSKCSDPLVTYVPKAGINAGLGKYTAVVVARDVAMKSSGVTKISSTSTRALSLYMFGKAKMELWKGAELYMKKSAIGVGTAPVPVIGKLVGNWAQFTTSIGIAIATTTAEIAAGKVASYYGFENKQIEAAAGFLAGVAAGAALGAAGGPLGAAGGAITAASVLTTGQVIEAMWRSGLGYHGSQANWVFAETGYVGASVVPNQQVTFYSYGGSDKLYAVAYDRRYFGDYHHEAFSAGQKQNDAFQVQVVSRAGTIGHFNRVWYKDRIRVAKSGPNQLCAVHCGGELSNSPATCVKKYGTLSLK